MQGKAMRHAKAFLAAALVLCVAGCGNLWMTYRDFDETPGSGWRASAGAADYAGAAAMADSYSSRRRDMAPWQLMNLRFHAAQMHACAGDYNAAVERLENVLLDGGHAGSHSRWNLYIRAHVAFLTGDIKGLRACRDEIASGPAMGGREMMLANVDTLIDGFGSPYSEVYTRLKE